MKRTMTTLLLSGSLFLGNMVQAQNLDNIPKVNPLPPNAAGLFKVLERPIGTFTGTVPIQFPLMNINSGPLSANLSLNYNSTGGIRVEEIAGSVGLGFSLNDGGGRIVQIVNDLPDDQLNGLLTNPTTPSNFTCTRMDELASALEEYEMDLEPDMFMYNLNGESGKFFLKEDGTIVMMQKTRLKFEYNQNDVPTSGIQEWIVTDELGNKYYFNVRGFGQSVYQSASSPSSTKTKITSFSWYLKRAHDINNENEITYTYQGSVTNQISFVGGFLVLSKINVLDCAGFNLTQDQATVETSAIDYIISRIDTQNGYIKINATTDRLDDYGAKVNSIELYAPNDERIKKYTFQYTYFNNSSTNRFVKRLKLKNFSEFGKTDLDSLTHSFNYNENGSMPNRISGNVDLWGFYNGKSSQSVFPNVVFKNGLGSVYQNYNLGVKNAVASYSELYTLNKITYPTGGYRELAYEGNTALIVFNPNEYHPDPSNSITNNFSINNTDFSFYDFDYDSASHSFSVNSTGGGTRLYYNTINPSNCSLRVKLFKIDPTIPFPFNQDILIFDVYSDNYEYNLTNGSYRLEIYKSPTCSIFDVQGKWTELTLSLGTVESPHSLHTNYNENNMPVGGVRVKEIRDYDPVSGETNKTEYKYKLYSTDSTLTSGLLITQPDLVVPSQHHYEVNCVYYQMFQSSHYPLASQGGSYVVYPEVRTIENGNGWTDRIYSYAEDTPPTSFPFVPPIDNSAYRGKLLEEKVFGQNGTLLKKTTNIYSHYGWQTGQSGLKFKAYFYSKGLPERPHQWSEFPFFIDQLPSVGLCNWYGLRGDALGMRRTIDSTFTSTGTFVTKTEYDYDFNSEERLFLKRIKQTVNEGDVNTKTFNYSYTDNSEFVFGLNSSEITMKNDLKAKNYRLPIEERDSLLVNGSADILLGGSKYSFANFNTNKTHLNQARIYTGANDYTALNFTNYGSKGQLQEKYRENGIKETYLWGYNGQYPVAKVTGSDYATISALVNNSILQNPISDLQLRTDLDKIRTNLAGSTAMVTTYTYDPLIGMTSMTDPRGYTLYYIYDDFNRLKEVRDADNKLISENEYHYKGQ